MCRVTKVTTQGIAEAVIAVTNRFDSIPTVEELEAAVNRENAETTAYNFDVEMLDTRDFAGMIGSIQELKRRYDKLTVDVLEEMLKSTTPEERETAWSLSEDGQLVANLLDMGNAEVQG